MRHPTGDPAAPVITTGLAGDDVRFEHTYLGERAAGLPVLEAAFGVGADSLVLTIG